LQTDVEHRWDLGQDEQDSAMEEQELTEKIIGCAMKVHSVLGPGFLESVYSRALAHELRETGLKVECEKLITVKYIGVVVGEFSADKLVAERVMVEEKAVQALVPAHEVQLVNYLTATGVEIGLLLNFGAQRLEFKRQYRTDREKAPSGDFTL
jgi:GxxExxY protein